MILGDPVFKNDGPVYQRFIVMLRDLIAEAVRAPMNSIQPPLSLIQGRRWTDGHIMQGAMLRRDET